MPARGVAPTFALLESRCHTQDPTLRKNRLPHLLQSFAEVLTPWVGWGGVGSAEVADRALRLSRPDVLMASAAPGKARCAELFPPGARHLVTLGNVADRYTHPDDQPDPPETMQ